MTIQPILAEDISPAVLLVFLVPLLLGAFAVGCVVLARRKGGASRAGLMLRLIPVALGGLILFALLTTRGGAPGFFIVAAAFPVVAGLLAVYSWGRKSPEAARSAALAFRFILYGCCALGFIYLCCLWFQRP